VTRRAVLGFHAARSIDRRGRTFAEPEASRAVEAAYPAPVRDWIARRGGGVACPCGSPEVVCFRHGYGQAVRIEENLLRANRHPQQA
jgi:hypothetical protein